MLLLLLCWHHRFLGAVTDLFAISTTSLLGLRLAPCFDRPYLSASMAEFWSQRWNVTTTFLLRCAAACAVIKPAVAGGRLCHCSLS